MAFQTWLADVLRAAGLTVHEVSGWRTRSATEDSDASTYRPHGVIIHETRGSATSTDAGEIGVLVNGRVGLSGPIAQLYLSRTGAWHVVAAGLCHHVKTGWGGPFSGEGNTRLLGIEPAHSVDEDWSRKPVQYASYVKGVAAILKHTGWPAPVGHKEHQPGDKPDPEFNMDQFRRDVTTAMNPQEDDMDTAQNNALSDAWSATVALRTGGDAPASTTRAAGPVWLVEQVQEIRDLVDQLVGRPAVTVDVAALAAAIVDKLPPTGLSRDDVETAVKDALREGTGA